MYATLAALLTTLLGIAIWITIQGLQPAQIKPSRTTKALTKNQLKTIRILAIGLIIGIALWMISGYFVTVLVSPVIAWLSPYLVPHSQGKKQIEKLTAMEEWARSLSGVLGAGAGIEQAIIASLPSTPAAIKNEVSMLVARLKTGIPIDKALEIFGNELDDVTGDLLTGSLIIGSKRRGSGLTKLLEGTAETISDDVAARRQIEADRAKPRSNARIISIIAITVITAQFIFNKSYVEPFQTPLGQILLICLSILFLIGLWWINSIAKEKKEPRLLKTLGGK